MTDDRDDKDMRELFHALKEEDARAAPLFDAMWKCARARRRARSRPWRLVGAIAAAIVLTLSGVLMRLSVRPTKPPESRIVVSEWRSPTWSLLKPLDDPLLNTVPRLVEPWGDITRGTLEKENGGLR